MNPIRTKLLLVLAVVALALLSLPLYGDTITDTNVQFTAFVASTTTTSQIQCLSASCSSWFLADVTVEGFTFTEAPVFGAAPSGYTLTNGGQDNTAVSAGGGCDDTQTGKAACWDAPLPLTTQLGTIPLVFTAHIIGGAVTRSLHVQATAFDNSAAEQQQGGEVSSVSNHFSDDTSLPEPSRLDLFDVVIILLSALLFFSCLLR